MKADRNLGDHPDDIYSEGGGGSTYRSSLHSGQGPGKVVHLKVLFGWILTHTHNSSLQNTCCKIIKTNPALSSNLKDKVYGESQLQVADDHNGWIAGTAEGDLDDDEDAGYDEADFVCL